MQLSLKMQFTAQARLALLLPQFYKLISNIMCVSTNKHPISCQNSHRLLSLLSQGEEKKTFFLLQKSAWATWCCVNSNMLPMSYRLSKPGLRYEEEISTLFFVNKSEKCYRSWNDYLHFPWNIFAFELVWIIWTI
jgi:hypothetical protein